MQHSFFQSVSTEPEDLRRAEASLTALTERIARLASLLGAPLATWDDLQKVLDRELPFFARHQALATAGWMQAAELRESRDAEELRALLLMRCELMTHLLQTHSLEDALRLASGVEAQLQREGFRPGAGGLTLLELLSQRPSGPSTNLDPPQAG